MRNRVRGHDTSGASSQKLRKHISREQAVHGDTHRRSHTCADEVADSFDHGGVPLKRYRPPESACGSATDRSREPTRPHRGRLVGFSAIRGAARLRRRRRPTPTAHSQRLVRSAALQTSPAASRARPLPRGQGLCRAQPADVRRAASASLSCQFSFIAVVRHHARPAKLFCNPVAQGVRSRRLAVGDEGHPWRRREVAKP